MDADTIGQKKNRASKCQCPQCLEWFTSGKARYKHQRQAHPTVRKRPAGSGRRLKPAAELYARAMPAV